MSAQKFPGVPNGSYFDPIVTECVNDAIVLDKSLSENVALKLRHDPSDLRMLFEAFDRCSNLFDDAFRSTSVPSEQISIELLQIVLSLWRPGNRYSSWSHSSIIATTSSWGIPSPRAS